MKKISLRRFFSNINLRMKLSIVFIMISIIPILIIGLASYSISASIVEQKVISDISNRLENVRNISDKIFSEKQFTGIKFSLDENVLYLLSNELSLTKQERSKYEFEVKKLLYDYTNTYGTQNIDLLSSNNTLYSNDEDKSTSENWNDYKEFLANSLTFYWGDAVTYEGEYVIPLVRKIITPELKTVGLLFVNLRESHLFNSYKEMEINNSMLLIIANRKGKIVSAQNKRLITENIETILGLPLSNNHSISGNSKITYSNEKYLSVYVFDDITGFYYISLIPVEEMLKSTGYIKLITFMICAVCLFLCLIASFFLSKSLAKPITKLIRYIENEASSNGQHTYETNGKDEIARLGQSYNSLVTRLNLSINDFYIEQKKKREAEIKALEFQINPHFLYNTLSSVVWLCEASENESAIRMTKDLANFFRISINKGKEMLTIQEEINHVKYYLEIQAMRYNYSFDVTYDIDPDIYCFYIPKIVLQPLVENAIYHGIKGLTQTRGVIILRGKKENSDIIIEVSDNGTSLSEDNIEELNKFLRKEASEQNNDYGIGISNVNDRIKLYFGEGYGLYFRKEDGYTKACLRIKIVKEC